jgi:hypothetical protein
MHSSICNFMLSCPNVARCHNFYITKLLSLLTWNCKNEVQKLCLSYGHPTESSTMRTRCEWHCLENVSKMTWKWVGKESERVRGRWLSNAQLPNAPPRYLTHVCLHSNRGLHNKPGASFQRKSNRAPITNQDFVCLLSNRGPHCKPRLCLFAMGKSVYPCYTFAIPLW